MSDPYRSPERQADEPSGSPRRSGTLVRLAAIGALAAVAGALFYFFGHLISLDYLAERETRLRAFQSAHPLLVYGIALAIYVIVTGLSLPGAAALTLVYGWYFGFWPAVILVSFASTSGATLAFLISRHLLGEMVQSRFGDRLSAFNRRLERDGALYLFTLRLIAAIPFFVINLVMGLTPIKTSTFWWVSQVGMLPGTIVYVYVGSSVPGLTMLARKGVEAVFSPPQLTQLAIALALLGLFPLVTRKLIGMIRQRRRPDEQPSLEE